MAPKRSLLASAPASKDIKRVRLEADKAILPAPSSLNTNLDITVLVGPPTKQQTFIVDRYTIINCSGFFKAALSGSWFEAQNNLVRLPEQNPEAFGIYVEHLKWTCTTWPRMQIHDPVRGFLRHRSYTLGWYTPAPLIKLWLLADYLQDTYFQGEVLEVLLRENTQVCLPRDLVVCICEATAPGCELRKWAVKVIVEDIVENDRYGEGLAPYREWLPADFVTELEDEYSTYCMRGYWRGVRV